MRAEFWREFGVSAFFLTALAANLFILAVVTIGKIRAESPEIHVTEPAMTAKVRRPMLDGTFCRSIVFDNTSGQTVEDKVERCDIYNSSSNSRSRSMLNWYGK